MMVNYSEHERQKIAETEYKTYKPNKKVVVKSDAGKYIEVGTVRQVVTDKTGLKAYEKATLFCTKFIKCFC